MALCGLGVGCAPPYHGSRHDGIRLTHGFGNASVHGDSLFVDGDMCPRVSLTDHGVKVVRAADDTGRELAFKSFQFFLSKDYPFELEFGAPASDAKFVELEVLFVSPSGTQRIKRQMPIERNPRLSYRHQPEVWSRDVWELTPTSGEKK